MRERPRCLISTLQGSRVGSWRLAAEIDGQVNGIFFSTMPNFISFAMSHLCWSLIIAAQYYNTLCVADLYQVNRTRTLYCSDIAEFVCSCSQTDSALVLWTVTSTSGTSRPLSFHTLFDSIGLVKTTTVDATTVTAKLVNSNSSFFESFLTISADLSSTIECNMENIQYQSGSLNKSTVVPSSVVLTPIAQQDAISYHITWAPSFFNTSSYLVAVTPPAEYTLSDAIIHNINLSYVFNITIALRHCPLIIYSNFIMNCSFVEVSEVMLYKLYLDGMSNLCNATLYAGYTSTQSNEEFSSNLSSIEVHQEEFNILGVIFTIFISIVIVVAIIVTIIVIVIFHQRKKYEQKMQEDEDAHDQNGLYSKLKYKYPSKKIPFRQPDTSIVTESSSNSNNNEEYNKIQASHRGNDISSLYSSLGNKNNSSKALSKIQRNKYCGVLVESDQHKDLNKPSILLDSTTTYSKVVIQLHPADKELNLDTLLIQLKPMMHQYKVLGQVAGISSDLLNQIETSAAVQYDGLVEVCDAWLRKCRDNDATLTWRQVADALSLIGQKQLSHDIMQVYKTGKLPNEVSMTEVDIAEITQPPPIPPYLGNAEVDLDVATSCLHMKEEQTNLPQLPPKLPPKPNVSMAF